MNKTFIIIKREFLTRIRKKSFIVLTILMPFIIAALVVVPLWLASIKDTDQKTVAVVDQTGHYLQTLKDTKTYHFFTAPAVLPEWRSDTSDVLAAVSITADLATNPRAVSIYSREEVSADLLSYIETSINEQVRKDKLAKSGIADLESIISDVQETVSISTVKWNDKGEEVSSNTGIAIATGFLFTFLIYMFVMSYGAMVMQSVTEEKTNRIVELMVSSVKPFQLMMGKIVGIALVGFVQLGIWALMLTGILLGASALFGTETAIGAAAGSGAAGMNLPTTDVAAASATADPNGSAEMLQAMQNLPFMELGIMFVLMFIGGYLLYASFFAAVGASVNEAEDTSQFMMPMVLVMLFGLYAAMYSVENTNGPLAFWSSLFPLTSPIVMMVRIPFGVPLWQELLSLLLLYATAIAFVWLGGRIYRVGILMYGKKPTIKEMLKWLRYK
ncbi:MAG: ABC transporter permease [Alloprevotella sp.]|nr:ABC transporter permease [Alloprevotella sp.]